MPISTNASDDTFLNEVYDELRAIAHERLLGERADLTLNTTDLVHELYEKLSAHTQLTWSSKAHFFALCSQFMRRILVDYARKKYSQKRGGPDRHKVQLSEEVAKLDMNYGTIIDVHTALEKLHDINAELAQLVEYRFFAGMPMESIAEVMSVSLPTVKRKWVLARGYLAELLKD